MIAAGSLLAVCAPFLLMGMSQGTQNMAGLVLSQLAWQFVIAVYAAPLTPWMVGRFPVRVRYIGLAIS